MTNFCLLLTVLFIGLQLGNVVAWSWCLVLAPLWVPLVIIGAFFFVVSSAR